MRAFIAFDLPANLRQELGQVSAGLQRSLAGAPLRWVAAGSIHLTLKFLGDVDPGQVAAIGERIQAAASGYAPFEVALTELGAFPSPRRPRVLWAGLRAPAALASLQQALEAQLESLGFEPEARPFTPHLTLARARREADARQLAGVASALAAEPLRPVSAHLQELTLFRSQLDPGGAVYNPLVQIQLTG